MTRPALLAALGFSVTRWHGHVYDGEEWRWETSLNHLALAVEDLLDRAAERGAERALVHLGLEGPHAAEDIRELRDLLEAWRDARRTAWRTVIRVATTSLLVVALLGAAIKFKFMGGSQ